MRRRQVVLGAPSGAHGETALVNNGVSFSKNIPKKQNKTKTNNKKRKEKKRKTKKEKEKTKNEKRKRKQ